ncbi:asparaginase [Psychrobacillus psychrotolerans]|uniref:asparaginase n=1 Tax=Psychrobacillus psychrotolerans TaxID=126156 RepID=UPI003C72C832
MKKKVVLITTGGTIASKEISTGLLSSGALSGKELAETCQLPEDIEIKIVDVLQLPSMHIDIEKMLLIRERILKELEDESVHGVVVTHGTDSLEETAYFLDLTIDDKRPIVVTGSQRSPGEVGTDVFSNLRNSFYVAIEETLNNVGTVVVFNERIYTAKHVKKVHTSNLQGFDTFGQGYLGIIDNNVVSIYQKPIKRETFNIKKTLPRVDIIKCYAGADGFLIDMLISKGTKGIVLEGVGRGQVSPLMVDAIDRSIAAGIKMVVTSSAEEGMVHPSYSYVGSAHDLLQRGVILGKDYDSKKARIRLAVQLASDMYS